MTTYRNAHVTVSVENHVHLLHQVWKGVPSSENYQNGCLVSTHLAEKHHVKRWLIDHSRLKMFNPRDLEWYTQQWLPQTAGRLNHRTRIAVVLSSMNQFGKLGADLILRAAMQANPALQSRYFVDAAEARRWLLVGRD